MTAAAACKDVDAERGDGEGLWPRKAVPSPVIVRVIIGDPEVDLDLEGGREFKSGAIAGQFKYGLELGWVEGTGMKDDASEIQRGETGGRQKWRYWWNGWMWRENDRLQ